MKSVTAIDNADRVTFRHLSRLTDDRGILEHAKGRHPRFSFGYCTDDNARLAVASLHDGGRSFGSEILGRIALNFIHDAVDESGMVRNRLSFQRVWVDSPSTDDCWGRALWAFGTAARLGFNDRIRIDLQHLLEDIDIEGATGILINITGTSSMTLHEISEASTLIQEAAHEDANIIFGAVIDETLGDTIRVTVIATGFDNVKSIFQDNGNQLSHINQNVSNHNQYF